MIKDNLKINTYQTREQACECASNKLSSLLSENKKNNILLLLSGGSSFSLLRNVDTSFLSNKVTIGVLDERYSKDPLVNNFAQLATLDFYNKSTRRGVNIIDTRVSNNETQKDLAIRFEDSLKNWLKSNPDGKIIATMGIGEDSHISGIMPFDNNKRFREMFEGNNLVSYYDAEDRNKYPLRVTTTITFIKKIDFTLLYVVGENKQLALDNVLIDKTDLNIYPARVIHDLKDATIYTDLQTFAEYEPT